MAQAASYGNEGAHTLTGEVKKRASWSIFMGVLIVALGAFLILYPFFTSVLTTVFLGWTLILVGVAELFHALSSSTAGQFFGRLLTGIVSGIAGILVAFFPLAGAASLTMIVGVLLLVEAGVETYVAFQIRPLDGWGWFLFDAIATFIVGALILASWPSSSIWAIGTLVGIAVVSQGITRIRIAATVQKGAGEVQRLAHA